MFRFKKKKIGLKEINEEIYKKTRIKRYLYLLIGLLLISIAFNGFLLPNDIVFGGVSGLSIIFKRIDNLIDLALDFIQFEIIRDACLVWVNSEITIAPYSHGMTTPVLFQNEPFGFFEHHLDMCCAVQSLQIDQLKDVRFIRFFNLQLNRIGIPYAVIVFCFVNALF